MKCSQLSFLLLICHICNVQSAPFVEDHHRQPHYNNNDQHDNNNEHEISMGTTIVALKTQQGVVVGADTRTSMSTMVSNRHANKLSVVYQQGPVSCVVCRSGSAADTQHLVDQATWVFRQRFLTTGVVFSMSQMARWLRHAILNGNYAASLLCAGYDPNDGDDDNNDGAGRIYSIAQSGSLVEEPVYAAAGSGSTFILGLLDSSWHDRLREVASDQHDDHDNSQQSPFWEEQEAIDLVAKLIHAAIARDGASGGVARIVVMNQHGTRELIVPANSKNGASLPTTSSSKQELKGFQPAKPPPKLTTAVLGVSGSKR